jgi:hypothetical protein
MTKKLITIFLSIIPMLTIGQIPITLTLDCPDDVVSGSQENHLIIIMENDLTVGAMQINVQFSPGNLVELTNQSVGDLTEGFITNCSHVDGMNDGEYTCLVLSIGMGLTIPPAFGSILDIEFSVDTVLTDISVSFSDAMIGGSQGQILEVDYSDTCSFPIIEPEIDPEVFLYIGDVDELAGTMEIRMTNTEVVCGFQFYISGVNLTGAMGISYPLPIMTSINGFVAGLTLMCGDIPPGDETLAILYFDEVTDNESCIFDAIFADEFGISLEVDVGECVSILYCNPGDLNEDSMLNILDVVLTVSCILENASCPCADLDSSGTIDVIDIVLMVELIIGEN